MAPPLFIPLRPPEPIEPELLNVVMVPPLPMPLPVLERIEPKLLSVVMVPSLEIPSLEAIAGAIEPLLSTVRLHNHEP